MALHVGDPAPALSAPDETGAVRTLDEFHGKWVVLYFYPKDDTPGCTKEACAFRDNIEELSKQAVVLGVSADSVESHKKFKEKYGLNFTLLADPERNIIGTYGTDGLIMAKRATFLIGPEGIIKKIYPQVDPGKHVDEILEDLKVLA